MATPNTYDQLCRTVVTDNTDVRARIVEQVLRYGQQHPHAHKAVVGCPPSHYPTVSRLLIHEHGWPSDRVCAGTRVGYIQTGPSDYDDREEATIEVTWA